jgi:hypothetical protein
MAYYDTSGTCDTSTAWVSWNDEYDSTCTSTTTTTNTETGVWQVWVGDVYAGTATDTAWTTWVTTADASCGTAPVVRQVSPEEIAAEQVRVREAADARQREREQAVVKAKALLHSLLDAQQRQQLERDRFFEFVSQTGRRMRMKHGYSRNIDVLGEDGKRVQTLCAHPRDWELVPEDHMVAQLLTLRHNEAAFMQVANRS